MPGISAKVNYVVLFILISIGTYVSRIYAEAIYPQISINLNYLPPGESITKFQKLTNLDYNNIINITNIHPNVSFMVIQIHTLTENLTLSYTDPIYVNSFTMGNHIGLVWNDEIPKKYGKNTIEAVLYLFRQMPVLAPVDVLLSVKTYTKYDPVPGGCNLSFETEIAPYQKINLSAAVITITSQPPSVFGEFCNRNTITTEMYYLFLPENSYNSDEYFQSIEKMMIYENVIKYGIKVRKGMGFTKFKQMYNKYTGTGRVFVVVSTYQGRNCVYVPIVSYGCNVNAWEEDCLGSSLYWNITIAFYIICGLLICLGGHRFFKITLFIIGYTFGATIMFLLDQDFSGKGKETNACIVGLLFGIIWVFLWWKFGVLVLAVELTFMLAGVLVASTLLFARWGEIDIFTNDLNFWMLFASIMVVTHTPLLCLKPLYHIIALGLLGSYAFIVAINYYMGGSLHYILINTYRRLTVRNFGMAIVDPPYQRLEIYYTLLWAVIFGLGVYVQYRYSIGKPPFPPHKSRTEFTYLNERTPLLHEERTIVSI
ncbi:transmembrane 7 superfamily member 3-like isoform X2 [Euwallacea fornicatus]|uniref:transmembrane 7 superfamily member 3-like isoform X2 n=1 Tax=Euwallacea fornicatus TaxID=995702 RepID=UPI00338F5B20